MLLVYHGNGGRYLIYVYLLKLVGGVVEYLLLAPVHLLRHSRRAARGRYSSARRFVLAEQFQTLDRDNWRYFVHASHHLRLMVALWLLHDCCQRRVIKSILRAVIALDDFRGAKPRERGTWND